MGKVIKNNLKSFGKYYFKWFLTLCFTTIACLLIFDTDISNVWYLKIIGSVCLVPLGKILMVDVSSPKDIKTMNARMDIKKYKICIRQQERQERRKFKLDVLDKKGQKRGRH